VVKFVAVDRSHLDSSASDRLPWGVLLRSMQTCVACLFLVAMCAGTALSQTPSRNPSTPKSEGQTYYLKGMELIRQGHIDEAIRVFEEGLTHDSQNAVMLDATGAAYMLKGDVEQAKRYLLASLRVNSGFIPARKNLAITYFNAGQYDLAAAEFQTLTKVPGSTQQIASLFLGMISGKKGEYARAVSLFGQSGGLLYRYPEALLSFANAECQLKRVEKAEAALKALDEIPGLTAQEHLKASQLYSQLGQDKLALAEAERAKEKDSHLEGLEYQHALALDRMGRSQEALEILRDLANAKPDADVLNLLSHVARENNEFALAIDSLRQAAKLAPEKEDNYLDFSTFCADYGNYQLALEAAEVGLENIPNSYRLLVQRAVVLENLGRLNEAEDALRKAGQQQKDNSLALLCLAIVQTHAGHLHEAETTLTAALREFPANYYMHYHLGIVLVELQGGLPPNPQIQAKAKHAFREAIRLNPSFADSYYQLAKLYSEESPKLAEQNLVACLRADPNHAAAEYKLARLYLSSGRQAEAQVLIDRFESLRQAAKLKEMQKPRIESTPR
jgi:tetratricopeptide (TPR) repeat protein